MVFELTLSSGFGRRTKHPICSFFRGFGRQSHIHPVRAIELNLAVYGLNFGRFVKKFFVAHVSTMIGAAGRSSATADRNATVRFGSKADITAMLEADRAWLWLAPRPLRLHGAVMGASQRAVTRGREVTYGQLRFRSGRVRGVAAPRPSAAASRLSPSLRAASRPLR